MTQAGRVGLGEFLAPCENRPTIELRAASDMNVRTRSNVTESGPTGASATLFLLHGYGCDQTMWRLLKPRYEARYKVVTYDHVGAGGSDLAAYDPEKYATLDGYAADLVDVVRECAQGPAIVVGHSVSAMVGLLADLRQPGLISGHAMLAPSPGYINDGEYVGGFSRQDISSLLDTLDANYLGWSSAITPALAGAPHSEEFAGELQNSFCRTDPDIAKRFARATFLGDYRAKLPELHTPTLVVQCDDDFIAPVAVGEYMAQVMPNCMLRVIANVGHCPHLTQPAPTAAAIDEFLASQGL